MTLVNIKKGDKLYLKYTVTVPQSFLRYNYIEKNIKIHYFFIFVLKFKIHNIMSQVAIQNRRA